MLIGMNDDSLILMARVGSNSEDTELNGARIRFIELTEKQEAEYSSLPPNSGVNFDGKSFSIIPLEINEPVDRIQIVIDELASKQGAGQAVKNLATKGK